MKTTEDFVDVPKAGKVWYQIVGKKNKVPLIVLHGGPGYPHESLKSLDDLSDEREVIYYDQLGCGNSQKNEDKSLWKVEYFVRELETLIKELGLREYHILGHSWGAALGVSFALTKQKGLRSLILADPYISTPVWEAEAARLISNFPEDYQKAILEENIESDSYKKAKKEYYKKHVFLTKKKIVELTKAHHKTNFDIYNYMWGNSEVRISGTLKELDLSKNLNKIKVPVLLVCGRFDEATPGATEFFSSLIPNSRMKVFEKSAHFPHWTERKEYMTTVSNFLKGIK